MGGGPDEWVGCGRFTGWRVCGPALPLRRPAAPQPRSPAAPLRDGVCAAGRQEYLLDACRAFLAEFRFSGLRFDSAHNMPDWLTRVSRGRGRERGGGGGGAR
jgi:hypothetical protein